MLSKKAQILDAASSLFRRKGYAATSMNDIAAVVGMKSASLYNHIQSKQDILQLLLLSVASEFVEEMSQIKRSSLSPLKKLEKLIGLHVRLTVTNPNRMALIVSDWNHLDSKERKKYIALRDSYEDDFREVIREGVEVGEFVDINVEVVLYSILSSLRWTYSWYSRHSEISPLDLENELIKCLITGLRNKA